MNRDEAIRLSSVNRKLAAQVARLERELEQERQLADKLAHWLSSLEIEDRVPVEWDAKVRNALAAWKAARNEAVNPP